MHFLTKFLVVVAAVLSVLLAGLSVAATSNTDAVAGRLGELERNYESALAQVSDLETRAQLQRELLEGRIAEARSARADAEADTERLRASLSNERRRLEEARRSVERFNSQIESFQALIATLEEADSARAAEVRELREDQIESARREIAMTDTINELAGRLEVLQETNRALQEEMTELRERAERLAEGGGEIGAGERATRRAPADLNTRVASVSEDPRGGQIVSIDAGTRDGLGEDMRLVVTRNGAFVATLIVERAGLNESVASVDVAGDGMSVSAGDVVVADRR